MVCLESTEFLQKVIIIIIIIIWGGMHRLIYMIHCDWLIYGLTSSGCDGCVVALMGAADEGVDDGADVVGGGGGDGVEEDKKEVCKVR